MARQAQHLLPVHSASVIAGCIQQPETRTLRCTFGPAIPLTGSLRIDPGAILCAPLCASFLGYLSSGTLNEEVLRSGTSSLSARMPHLRPQNIPVEVGCRHMLLTTQLQKRQNSQAPRIPSEMPLSYLQADQLPPQGTSTICPQYTKQVVCTLKKWNPACRDTRNPKKASLQRATCERWCPPQGLQHHPPRWSASPWEPKG